MTAPVATEPPWPAEKLRQLVLSSETETRALAARFSDVIAPGDILLLSGALGTGKTAFARALIQSRQGTMADDVPSPTFTLVQTYDAGAIEIWHADLYRLDGPDDIAELGLLDAAETAVLLVEWPEKAGPIWPDTAMWMRFDMAGQAARQVGLYGKPASVSAQRLLAGFQVP
ncbi:MAG: tRNA (adenosine(37)-N6)-threonylcarbamoyltransferase complex ATPase subunit type 1 TsaE [Pseudomonadota bacterium]